MNTEQLAERFSPRPRASRERPGGDLRQANRPPGEGSDTLQVNQRLIRRRAKTVVPGKDSSVDPVFVAGAWQSEKEAPNTRYEINITWSCCPEDRSLASGCLSRRSFRCHPPHRPMIHSQDRRPLRWSRYRWRCKSISSAASFLQVPSTVVPLLSYEQGSSDDLSLQATLTWWKPGPTQPVQLVARHEVFSKSE